MIEALRGVEVCVTQMAPLTEKILDASPDLRLFCISRGGPVNANLDGRHPARRRRHLRARPQRHRHRRTHPRR